MGTLLFLFTLVLFPLLLGVLSHLSSILHHNNNNNINLSTLDHHPLLPSPFHHHCNHSRVRESMDEKREEQKPMMRRKISLQNIDVEDAQKRPMTMTMTMTSPPSSPLKKSLSTRTTNCLCSPTTHIGSFRCRLHRHAPATKSSNMRRGHSVGSNLSELANKFSSTTTSTLSTSSLQTSASSSQMQCD